MWTLTLPVFWALCGCLLFVLKRHTADVETAHRVVCVGFQTLWLCVAGFLLYWCTTDVRPFVLLGEALVAYFVYDAAVLMTYTRRIVVFYVHHAVGVFLVYIYHGTASVATARHLAVLGLCLEFCNPLINASWIVAHTYPHRWHLSPLLRCVVGFFVCSGFIVVRIFGLAYLWRASPSPVVAAANVFFAGLSLLWFPQLVRVYFRQKYQRRAV